MFLFKHWVADAVALPPAELVLTEDQAVAVAVQAE
jgi:hypothetical protein